jgi:hypothetical protein
LDNGPNGTADGLCKTIKNVMSSVAEAETGEIYMDGQYACPMHAALKELSHPQPITRSPFETYNSTPPKASKIPKCAKSFPNLSRTCATLVDERQNQPRPIQSHLGPRQPKPRQLFHEMPPTQATPPDALHIPSNGQQRFTSPANKATRGTQSTLTSWQIRAIRKLQPLG